MTHVTLSWIPRRAVWYPGELRPGCPRRRGLRPQQPRMLAVARTGAVVGATRPIAGRAGFARKDRVASLPSTDLWRTW